MKKSIFDELEIRLKAPIVALEKIVEGKSLPKVFARVALEELKKVQAIVKKTSKLAQAEIKEG